MSGVVLIAFLSLYALVWELVPLFKKRFLKDAFLYLFLLIIGVFLSVRTVLLLDLPSPMIFLKIVYGPILKWLAL